MRAKHLITNHDQKKKIEFHGKRRRKKKPEINSDADFKICMYCG